MLDPGGGDNNKYATGFEEGAAGIGWVHLQANILTGDNKYLEPVQNLLTSLCY
jgi:hypothetical protein